jgi:hypothetical protein
MTYGGPGYRINQHRRKCSGPCKDWKYIKGGAMKGNGKGNARKFICVDCNAPQN